MADEHEEKESAVALRDQVGLGVDIVEIARMTEVLERTAGFKDRVYTEGERAYCESKATPEIHYATRFAAKEAVLKALGTGFQFGKYDPREVEVKRTSKGRPYVVLHGATKQLAEEQGILEVPISLSYTHTEAVACAMAITPDATVAPVKADPMEELTRQFKEVRGMLDNLDALAVEDAPTASEE